MKPLNIIFALIIFLISIFLCVQSIKLYRRFRRASDNTTAKNIYVIKYNDSVNENTFPKIRTAFKPGGFRPEVSNGPERRKYPRTEYHGFVDFINEGTLYKEQARDLSYSGIFIQSRTPEKYKINDFIVMTFQTEEAGPQRQNGRIARINPTGIGVNFVR